MATPETTTDSPIRVEVCKGGRIWQVWLNAPKANVIDATMIAALDGTFRAAASADELKAILLTGTGAHFSFGASVEDHLPEHVGEMLPAFHTMLRALLEARVPTLAAVQGQCLGGGLELAAMCHRVFATPDARLGQPEIVLGVFAPVGSALLAHRVGAGVAYDLCMTGRSISGERAHEVGLVDQLSHDPVAAAVAYAEDHLLPRSASSLRFAVQAAQIGFHRRFVDDLERCERLYLDELMRTADAAEGIRAFVDKRTPTWRDA